MFCKGEGVAKDLVVFGCGSGFDHFGVSSWCSGPVALLDKAASYSACQVLTAHDARYASSKRSERAQPSDGFL
jgi:hypothetical protein